MHHGNKTRRTRRRHSQERTGPATPPYPAGRARSQSSCRSSAARRSPWSGGSPSSCASCHCASPGPAASTGVSRIIGWPAMASQTHPVREVVVQLGQLVLVRLHQRKQVRIQRLVLQECRAPTQVAGVKPHSSKRQRTLVNEHVRPCLPPPYRQTQLYDGAHAESRDPQTPPTGPGKARTSASAAALHVQQTHLRWAWGRTK